jgi:hypothetical protein
VEIEVRYATPDDVEGIAALYHRVYDGSYPVTECTDPALVRRIVTNEEHIWVLALAGDRVVGASVARPDAVNSSYELCRGAVDPGYRGRANYGGVFARSLRDAVERPDCELIYGYARSEHARTVFSRHCVSWSWTGTDGGMHRVAGGREEHLFGMFFNPERVVTRIVPPRSILIPDSAVAHEITVQQAITVTGDYPSQLAAHRAAEFTHESDRGRVSYSVIEPSRAAVVGAVEGDTPEDVRHVLWELLDGAAPSKIEHMTIRLLADKVWVIAELCRPDAGDWTRRFAVRGYLPGWHKEGDLRYDCVTLTVRLGEQIPERLGFGDRVEAIYRSFPLAFR